MTPSSLQPQPTRSARPILAPAAMAFAIPAPAAAA